MRRDTQREYGVSEKWAVEASDTHLFLVALARSAPSKTLTELGLWPQSPVGIRAQRIRQARRASKRASESGTGIGSSVAKKPPDMTNHVIAFVCLLGLSGVLGQGQDFDYKQPSDYYRGKRGRVRVQNKDKHQ